MENTIERCIVKYTGNDRGHIQTDKWKGSIFEVRGRDESWEVTSILYKAVDFYCDNPSQISFYKFNAVVMKQLQSFNSSFDDNLFELG